MSSKRKPWPELGASLRQHRERLSFSRKETGAALGISDVAIFKMETGRSTPSAWQLRQLCLLYRVSADDLLGLTGQGLAATCVRNLSGTPSSISKASNAASERTMT